MSTKHVVILGGGFAGLECAKKLGDEKIRVTQVDRWNHHLFQPLLYQVASGALAMAEIAQPPAQYFGRSEKCDHADGRGP